MKTVRRRDFSVQSYPARDAGQMSHTKGFDRRRSASAMRRVSVAPVITKHAAIVFWADLVSRRCASREECAVMFGVTFQTSCNWHDGFSCPTGDKVMIAMQLWPEEFGK
jgi:hypothetical protein